MAGLALGLVPVASGAVGPREGEFGVDAPDSAASAGEPPAPRSGEDPIGGAPAPQVRQLQAPVLVDNSPALYPESLRGQSVGGEVQLEILIEASGAVGEVNLLQGVHPLLDEAAITAAHGLIFEAARLGDEPVAVRIHFTYRFEILPPAAAPGVGGTGAAPRGALIGLVRSKGNRRPVAGASLACEGAVATTDGEGRFKLELPAGRRRFEVHAAGYLPASFEETIEAEGRVEVVYAIEPKQLNPYETVVRGERDRTEVSRVSLNRAEIREVPGTMGDPFRVVMLMPGVGSMVSGVPYPVVRGAAPAATGYFLDGIRLPVLFHLFLGPSVLHPQFIEGLDFFAGAPPPRYGRLTGGVIEGRLARPRQDRVHASAYLDLINAGAFVEVPFQSTETNLTLAGRYSYTPWLVALAANSVQTARPNEKQLEYVMDFWDYQARLEQKVGPGRLRLFALGSRDEAGRETDDLSVTAGKEQVLFHRLDLRWQAPLAGGELEVGATVGRDDMGFYYQGANYGTAAFSVVENSLMGRAHWTGALGERLRLNLGGDVDHRSARSALDIHVINFEPMTVDAMTATGTFLGGYAELVWQSPSKAWTVVPGLRFDHYHLVPNVGRQALEPRLTVRRSFGERFQWKGAAGLYHQQPTTLVQLPVVDMASLRLGIQEAVQLDTGVEWELFEGLELVADVYYNPLVRSIELNPFDPEAVRILANEAMGDGTLVSKTPSLLRRQDLLAHGQAYGLELMLRHPLGKNWFGWLSYAWQHSSRWTGYNMFDERGVLVGRGYGYLPYAFDQTHIVNGVLSFKVGNWTLGASAHFHTGRPETGVLTSLHMEPGQDPAGDSSWNRVDNIRAPRLPNFFRLDLRVARTWVFDDFYLEGYLDVLNATVSREVIAYRYLGGSTRGGGRMKKEDEGLPLVLPIVGLKGTY